jgi:intracellular septation protein
MSSQPPTSTPDPARQQSIKLLIELSPLVLFFGTWFLRDLRTATAVLMVTTVVGLLAARWLLGHVTPVQIGTTAIVWLTGSLTLWLNDDSFIKMKPTFVNLAFAGVLGYGLLRERPLLRHVLGDALRLTAEGWRQLTIRWVAFFVAMAALNEVIWRTLSEASWITFKSFGIISLTIAFTIAQVGLIKRYAVEDEPADDPKR